MATLAGLSVKCSPNSQTLKMMLANGSVMTSSGWDTASGPTCSAPCCSRAPVMVAAMNAYTGQSVSMAPMPETDSVWVAVFKNDASRAAVSPVAAASAAARRAGAPRRPSKVSTAMAPPNTSPADSHCFPAGKGWPPVGSPTARNTARLTHTTVTDAQAARATSWRIHTRRSTSTKTSSVTSSGWTTDIGPLCRASAWNTNEPTAAATPSSHSGCRGRYSASRQPFTRFGAPMLALCWVSTLTALANAAASANTTARNIPVPLSRSAAARRVPGPLRAGGNAQRPAYGSLPLDPATPMGAAAFAAGAALRCRATRA